MADTLRSPEEMGFSITGIDQLIGNPRYHWKNSKEPLGNGPYTASIIQEINEKGGLTDQELLDNHAIYKD